MLILFVLFLAGCGLMYRGEYERHRPEKSQVYLGIRSDIMWSLHAPTNGLAMCGGNFDLSVCLIYGPLVAAGTVVTGAASLPFDAVIDTALLPKDVADAADLDFDFHFWSQEKMPQRRNASRFDRVLKNISEVVRARREQPKTRSVCAIHEPFEAVFNADQATQVAFQHPIKRNRVIYSAAPNISCVPPIPPVISIESPASTQLLNSASGQTKQRHGSE